jgi:hypothetical protein
MTQVLQIRAATRTLLLMVAFHISLAPRKATRVPIIGAFTPPNTAVINMILTWWKFLFHRR